MSTTTPRTRDRWLSTETKAAYKTTEFVFYLLTVVGVLIASAVVDDHDDGVGFDTQEAWFLVALLTIGYMISRGLAKSGSREPYEDTHDRDRDYTDTNAGRRSATSAAVTPETRSTGTTGTTRSTS